MEANWKMLGKTHFTMGIAAALIVTHPTTVSGVLAAVAAGGIGGKLPDIDQKKPKIKRESIYNTIIELIFIGILIAVDCFIGNGFCRYIADHWGPRVWFGFAGIVALIIIGNKTEHRSFTHSLVCLTLFGVSVYCACLPMALPFAVGYASHIVLDLFNIKEISLFFPLKYKFSLKLCEARGNVNTVLYWIGLSFAVILGAVFLFRALLNAGML